MGLKLDATVVAGVVALDLATKAAVLRLLAPGDVVDVVGTWVRLVDVRNVGAAFGLLAGLPWAGPVFTIVTAGAIAGLLLYRVLAPPAGPARLGLPLVLGGAIGNLVDRLRFGHVVDFVDIGIGAWRWPAFNVADAAITVGVVCLLVAPARRQASAEAGEAA